MTTTTKLEAVCAVCFRVHKLYAKGTLVRHGFQIHGRRNGEWGNAWHTGPCNGWSFPHFGKSTEGSEWALGKVRAYLAAQEERLAELATNPELTWTPSDWDRKRYNAQNQKLNHGDKRRSVKPSEESPDWKGNVHAFYDVPAYDSVHKSRVSETEANIRGAKHDIAMYEEAIKTWVPRDPVPVKSKSTVHKAANWKGKANRPTTSLCKQWSMHHPTGMAVTTTDDAQVTCKSCLRTLDTDAKEKAKKAKADAENKTYRVTFPNGETRTTTNKRESNKREFVSAVVAKSSYDGRWHLAKWAVSESTAKKAVREYKKAGWDEVQITELEVIESFELTDKERERMGKWAY
jgi:hypothetical protein